VASKRHLEQCYSIPDLSIRIAFIYDKAPFAKKEDLDKFVKMEMMVDYDKHMQQSLEQQKLELEQK